MDGRRKDDSLTGRTRRRRRRRTRRIGMRRQRDLVRLGVFIIALKSRNTTGLRNNNKSGHLQCTSLTVAVRPTCRRAKYPAPIVFRAGNGVSSVPQLPEASVKTWKRFGGELNSIVPIPTDGRRFSDGPYFHRKLFRPTSRSHCAYRALHARSSM